MPSLGGTGGATTYADLVNLGLGGCCGCRDLARRSPIIFLRREIGIRLMRISTRDRSSEARALYWARNRRARSVTMSITC